MSTFDGVVAEFPRIRIDHFRLNSLHPPPVACFLSHVHSDHLLGLESLKSPFVYCSHATRSLLLTMEKYPHRMNFAKGILEARVQSYKHLKTVLRPIPLRTPTEIELGPVEKIRVTLFDANHCPGAVMFLIEGSGKAILYTGDVRAEQWWVDQIATEPILLPYMRGLAILDRVYLDTTFAVKQNIYREFPSKADGLSELLNKVAKYPSNTVFYFRAWTLGYENVWIALSSFLHTHIHVDDYQWRLYSSLAGLNETSDALHGFQFGNQQHPGCFTFDGNVRIHSCEPGTTCHGGLSKQDVVWITPIISRTRQGQEVLELGAGGGGGDLYQVPFLDITDVQAVERLEKLVEEKIKDESVRARILQRLETALDAGGARLPLEEMEKDVYEDISIIELITLLSANTGHRDHRLKSTRRRTALGDLPDTIHFPYSRHSSYNELCHLLSLFKPKDVYPCTVDPETWSEEVSMSYLFGHCCCEQIFSHDQQMRLEMQARAQREHSQTRQKRKRTREMDSEASQRTDLQEEESSQNPSFETANEPNIPTATTRSIDDDNDNNNNDATTTLDIGHEPPRSIHRPQNALAPPSHPLPTTSAPPPPLIPASTDPHPIPSRPSLLPPFSASLAPPQWTPAQKAVMRCHRSLARASGAGIEWLDGSISSADDDDDDEASAAAARNETARASEHPQPRVSSISSNSNGSFAATLAIAVGGQVDDGVIDEDDDNADPAATRPPDGNTRSSRKRQQRIGNAYRAALASLQKDGGSAEWEDFTPISCVGHTVDEEEL